MEQSELRTKLPSDQIPDTKKLPAKWSKTTYRIRGIHNSFDRTSLRIALCTHFHIENDEINLRSLAYDKTYSSSSCWKVATVTFRTTPDSLSVVNRLTVTISLSKGGLEEPHDVIFDTTFEGFTPLTAFDKEDGTTTDCIFIHGWAGHSIGSFSSPDGDWFWPIDGLLDDMPKLRVFLYGYNSNLRDRSSVADVHEYADTFKRGLVDFRRLSDSENASRPIIYIAHSLGGCLLQHAINDMAASEQPDDTATLQMTRGALLFGVPSLGMESRALLNLTTLDDLPAAWTASRLDERYGFRQHMEVADEFYATCAKLNASIYTFYETVTTPTVVCDDATKCWVRKGPQELLVKQGSATYGCSARQNKIRWDSNHSEMLKLRKGDDRYQTLLGRLQEIQRVEKKQEEWHEADKMIRSYYNSCGRLEIERLSVVEQSEKKQDETGTSFSYSLEERLWLDAKSIGQTISINDLFESRKLSDGTTGLPRRIHIEGQAGVGKTTLCKKLVHTFLSASGWDKIFDRLLWVPLRRLKRKQGYSWRDLIEDSHYLKDQRWQQVRNEYSQQFDDPRFLDRTLLLFDGFDEVSQLWPYDADIYEFLAQIISGSPNVIMTSRPHAKRFYSGKFHLHLETIGFLPEQIDEYLGHCVSKDLVAEMKSFMMERPLIQSLLRIPVQLDAFCTTWVSGKEIHGHDRNAISTMTTLYNSMMHDLCRKDIARSKKTEHFYKLSDSEVVSKLKNELSYLGELAFQGLVNNIIEYDPEYSDKIGECAEQRAIVLPTPRASVLEGASFVRSSEKEQDPSKAIYHFIHLTFQEFFAARHFVEHWQNNNSITCLPLISVRQHEDLLPVTILQKEKDNPRYNIFWHFVTGLLQTRSSLQHGRDMNVTGFFKQLHEQPVDLLGFAHSRLVMCCLSEVVAADDETSKLQNKEEMVLYEQITKTSDYYSQYDFASAMEFPESVLCSVLKPDQTVDMDGTLSGIESRPFIGAKLLWTLSELLSSEGFTALDAAKVILKNSQMASNELLRKTTDFVCSKLRHEDSIDRWRAICVIEDFPMLFQKYQDSIIIALKDEHPYVRIVAVAILSDQAFLSLEAIHGIVTMLMELLGKKDHWPRDPIRVAKTIVQRSSSIRDAWHHLVIALREILYGGKAITRISAARVLAAYSSITKEEKRKVVTVLTESLKDEDITVQTSTMKTLAEFSSIIVESSEEERRTIVTILTEAMESNDTDLRQAAANALVEASFATQEDEPLATTVLIEGLKNNDYSLQIDAVESLAKVTILSREAVDALIAVLKSGTKFMQSRALRALDRRKMVSWDLLAAVITGHDFFESYGEVSREVISILHQRNLFSRIMELDHQAWRNVWVMWQRRQARNNLCCYEYQGSLYLWSEGTLFTLSTDAKKTREFLDCVLTSAEEERSPKEEEHKPKKEKRRLKKFVKKIFR